MSSPFGPLRLIVNPHAGRGRVGRTLPQLQAALRERDLEHDVVETTGPGDGTRAARQALEEGRRFLVAVGGDGTVHEVVNGMFDVPSPEGADAGGLPTPVRADAVLGVVAAGSGCDFVRTFGLDRQPEIVARHMDGDATMSIDVGLAQYVDAAGARATRVFANIAEVGYGAEVVRRAARLPRMLGRSRYLFAAWGAIRGLHRQEAAVTVDHTTAEVPVVNLVVANCQFFGGGMKVAPRALPDDGKFNVQIFTGERSQVFTMTSKIYRGEHLPHPNVVEYQSATAALAPAVPLPVEADGEVLGTTPASFRIAEQVLRLKI